MFGHFSNVINAIVPLIGSAFERAAYCCSFCTHAIIPKPIRFAFWIFAMCLTTSVTAGTYIGLHTAWYVTRFAVRTIFPRFGSIIRATINISWWYFCFCVYKSLFAPPAEDQQDINNRASVWYISYARFSTTAFWCLFAWPYGCITAFLSDPSLIFSATVLWYITIFSVTSFLYIYISCVANHFQPMYLQSWIDWYAPPETIKQTIRGKDGYHEINARDFSRLLKPEQFRLDRAHLSTDTTQSHPKAARRRAANNNMFEAFGRRHGLEVCDHEMSHRNCERNVKGSRVIADSKDAASYSDEQLKWWPDPALPGSLHLHTDTFTHKGWLDANHTLSDGNVHCLYTWNPTAIAGQSDELTFFWDKWNRFVTEVAGSHEYLDNLWNFESDVLTTWTLSFESVLPWRCSTRRLACTQSLLLVTAVSIFLYNQYSNYLYNQNLSVFFHLHYEWLSYVLYYPTFAVRYFTAPRHESYYSAVVHLANNFGLPTSWLTYFYGLPYLTYTWSSIVMDYPSFVEPRTMTPTHHWAIAALLSLAINNVVQLVAVSHKVARIDVGEHRCAVMIVPHNRFRGLSAILRPFLNDANLAPRKPKSFTCDSGYPAVAERYKAQNGEPAYYSAAYLGSTRAHHISDVASDTVKALTTSKSPPSLSNVKNTSVTQGDEVGHTAAALAIGLHKLTDKDPEYFTSYSFLPLPTIVRQTTEEKENGMELKDIKAHQVMNPVVKGCAYVHSKTVGNVRDTVKRRLRKPGNQVRGHVMTPKLAKYTKEFADQIKIEVGAGSCKDGFLDLYDEDKYIEERNKPQLRKFQTVQDIYDINNHDERKGFLKREIHSKGHKAARPICQFPPESQALGGRIALAYASALKACSWVGSGQDPSQISDSVSDVCAGADYINATDFTAQDATVTLVDRVIELFLLKNLFHPGENGSLHKIIDDWHYTDYEGCVLYGDPGTKRVKHDFNGSRGSGSPFTTYGNTPLTGLYAYIALRESGSSPEEAYAKLGIYSGDDGITANLPAAAASTAAKIMGFIIKSEICTEYIPYLGRIWFDPIGGSRSSIQDPLRTLGKLHATLLDDEQFTAHEAMLLKATCLQITDRDSDFFGPWSKKVLEDAGMQQQQSLEAKVLKFPHLHAYFAVTALKTKTSFHNHPGDFERLFEIQMPGFDWAAFKLWLDKGPVGSQCPTLWEKPEPTAAEMEEGGDASIYYKGVDDEANAVHYTKTDTKQHNKPKQPPRSRSQQAELLEVLKKHNKLKEYRAAKVDKNDDEATHNVKKTMRREIEKYVTSLCSTPKE